MMVLDDAQRAAARCVQVNAPYRMLFTEGLLELFLSLGLNPELGMDIPALEGYDSAHFGETAAMFHRAGARLTLHGPFEGVNPGAADRVLREASLRHLEQMVKAVEAMGPEAVVCHTGFHPGSPDGDGREWLARSRGVWGELAATLASMGCTLLLENVLERTPFEMARMVTGIDHLGICLDTGHLTAYGDGDLAGWVAALGPLIREVHLHDNHGDTDAHLPPGQGGIDFSPLLELARHQPLIITLEPHTAADLSPALAFLACHPALLSGGTGDGGKPSGRR